MDAAEENGPWDSSDLTVLRRRTILQAHTLFEQSTKRQKSLKGKNQLNIAKARDRLRNEKLRRATIVPRKHAVQSHEIDWIASTGEELLEKYDLFDMSKVSDVSNISFSSTSTSK